MVSLCRKGEVQDEAGVPCKALEIHFAVLICFNLLQKQTADLTLRFCISYVRTTVNVMRQCLKVQYVLKQEGAIQKELLVAFYVLNTAILGVLHTIVRPNHHFHTVGINMFHKDSRMLSKVLTLVMLEKKLLQTLQDTANCSTGIYFILADYHHQMVSYFSSDPAFVYYTKESACFVLLPSLCQQTCRIRMTDVL